MEDYDVVIIGAGPAGSSAAKILEEKGHKIHIIDKKIFPRSKPCAGVLSPKIRSLIEIPEVICERLLQGYRVFSPSGIVVESSFPEKGFIVRRRKFDTFLVEQLKNQPTHKTVKGIKDMGKHLEIEGDNWSCKARFAIGADGANSVISKCCNITQKRIAAAAQYEIKLSSDDIDKRIGNWFEVYYTLSYGYGWISPMQDGLKIGVGIVTDYLKENIWNVLTRFMNQDGVKQKWNGGEVINKEGANIPMAGPLETLASNRILLVGDAGGFVYPGTGEGIFYAIKSGRIAGKVIDHAIVNNESDIASLEKHYSKELENNGLLGLRDVEFVEKYLSNSKNAERYVKRLKHIAGGNSIS
ncbi:MAG: geranylgeranyl reductase family protein [Thermoplasmatales archaeon]|nr:MAG: geranylgeranyl reductase family protein [Thermoplasmatales archaeon]